jgi:hypothetical protein
MVGIGCIMILTGAVNSFALPGNTLDVQGTVGGGCVPTTCQPLHQCGSTAGIDNCGNPCTVSAGTCQEPKKCINNTCSKR